MKQHYPRKAIFCELVKARPETVRFLTDYSKSLRITRHKDLDFESNLN